MTLRKVGVVVATLLVFTTAFASANDKEDASAKGRAAFKGNCVSCHGPDGGGTPVRQEHKRSRFALSGRSKEIRSTTGANYCRRKGQYAVFQAALRCPTSAGF